MITAQLSEQGNIDSSVAYFRTFQIDRASRILDVGTRFGSFLHGLDQLGYRNTTGIDLDSSALEAGRLAYPHLAGRLCPGDEKRLIFADGEFDVITAFDVIEHIPDVAFMLREIRRVLRPDGLFIFQTPNILTNIPKEIIYTHSLTGWRTYHCSLQTLGSLRRRLRQAGFTDIVVEKRAICTEFNLTEAREHLGALGPVVLRGLQRLPLMIYPNFWGHARRG